MKIEKRQQRKYSKLIGNNKILEKQIEYINKICYISPISFINSIRLIYSYTEEQFIETIYYKKLKLALSPVSSFSIQRLYSESISKNQQDKTEILSYTQKITSDIYDFKFLAVLTSSLKPTLYVDMNKLIISKLCLNLSLVFNHTTKPIDITPLINSFCLFNKYMVSMLIDLETKKQLLDILTLASRNIDISGEIISYLGMSYYFHEYIDKQYKTVLINNWKHTILHRQPKIISKFVLANDSRVRESIDTVYNSIYQPNIWEINLEYCYKVKLNTSNIGEINCAIL